MAIVETRSGKVEGIERDGVHVFRGIPYAEPPVGPRRWQAAARARSRGTACATRPRSRRESAQTAFALAKCSAHAQPPCSEDCLYLNVWTRVRRRRAGRSWSGSTAARSSRARATRPGTTARKFAVHGDVVVVTINYRLGPFGFLHLADLFGAEFAARATPASSTRSPRSNGSATHRGVRRRPRPRDGLRRVGRRRQRRHAARLPAARGLFHGAIPQSGAASWFSTRERAPTSRGTSTSSASGRATSTRCCGRRSTTRSRRSPTSAVRTASRRSPSNRSSTASCCTQPPLAAIAAGNAAGVHVLTGTNLTR